MTARWTTAAVVVTLSGLLVPWDAGAQPAPEAFEWIAPEGCPDRTAVVHATEANLGRALAQALGPEGRVRGEVTVTETGGFRLALEVHGAGGDGQRVVEAATCAELADAAVVIVGLALDGARPAPPEPPAPPPAAPPPRPRPPARRPRPAADHDDADTLGAHLELQGRALVDVGNLPGPALGLGVVAALGNGRQWIEVGTTTFFERRASVPTDPPSGADVRLVEVSVGACQALSLALAWELRLCATVHGGTLHGNGFGSPAAHDGSGSWTAASLGGGLWWRLVGPLSLFAGLDGLVSFTRPRFVVAEGQEAHQPAPVSARLVLGPALRWP